jgi:hypothetical protein
MKILKIIFHSCIVVLCFLTISYPALGQNKPILDPVEDFAEPYAESVSKDALIEERTLIKITADLNGDRINDIAICESVISGNGGGDFSIYLGLTSHRYVLVGHLSFWPETIHIRPLGKGKSSIATYANSGFSDSTWGYGYSFYELSKSGIRYLGQKYRVVPLDSNRIPMINPEPWELQLPPPLTDYKGAQCKLMDYLNDRKCAWSPW